MLINPSFSIIPPAELIASTVSIWIFPEGLFARVPPDWLSKNPPPARVMKPSLVIVPALLVVPVGLLLLKNPAFVIRPLFVKVPN